MTNQFLCSFLAFFLYSGIISQPYTAAGADRVCGKWQMVGESLVIQVYRDGGEFKAKILWFDDEDDTKPTDYWKDVRNPDPHLRSRKILGLNVVEKLSYNPKTDSWEDGMIYDPKHGRHWNASAYINKDGLLKVKGYWHFKFIGKTLTFKRVN
ncbi:DUF2147 domain-containing protein [Mucilaginibacter sp. 14171R-50]|uniref:DUF2147 domain-containing protein n=1 Tax=Mucilaginibacter sp. 14171R-50 TaxID=2703789 RepID=UPI00138BF05F|nr:DUF2147 domain-containing protein [Mucilaginibacter sp. 14171R-50]QHS56164.1 DUF2147 domain-containing protein [Mucilaginibacter sp. 14171R-50]